VQAAGDWHPFQEFMIKLSGADPETIELRGIGEASLTPEVADAIASAEVIVIGPSNPVISIGPILEVPGMREALAAAGAPIVAVSPFVHGDVLKGPTDAFCRMAALGSGTPAIEKAYAGVIDGVITDSPGLFAALQTETLMDTPEARRRVAEEALDFARLLSARG
jgi:LPPG:FO 2-phospho-L-lactate transferase